MSSSRNYDSASAYREEHESSENQDTFLKSKRRKDISFSYSILVNPSTHGNSDDGESDAGRSDYDTRVSKKSSLSGKRRGSAVTNTTNSTSYASDMSSSAGRSHSDFFFCQERVPEEKSDDVRRRYASTDTGYPDSSSQSSRLKRRVERRKMRDYDNDVGKSSRVRSPYREYRRTRQARDSRSRGVPRSRVLRQANEPRDHKEMVEQVRYKLAECSERAKFQSPSRRKQKDRRSRSSKSDDLHKYESRDRKYRSRTPEDLRSPYKTPRRSTFRSPSHSPKHVNSAKRSSDSRSSSGERNSQSRSSSPVARRGRHRSKFSSRDNSPFRRREASSSERDLETVYRNRRKNRNHDSTDSPSPKHSRRRKNKTSVRDDKYRRSKARYSKRGSGDDEKSLSRNRSDSYLGQRDRSTRSSRCRSRRSENYYSPKRSDSSERYYSKEVKANPRYLRVAERTDERENEQKYSRGRSSSPRHASHNSPRYRHRQSPDERHQLSPEERLKVSEWLPGCRLRNIEARGGKRDFRQWFTVLPPNVQVDQDLRTDRGVFKKDNFQSSQALDKYLGIVNSRSPVDRRDDNSRSPG